MHKHVAGKKNENYKRADWSRQQPTSASALPCPPLFSLRSLSLAVQTVETGSAHVYTRKYVPAAS